MEETLPNYMRLSNDFHTGKNLKPLSSFISANVNKDINGAYRIPCKFIADFGEKLPYYLNIRCNNIMWFAIYDKDSKKMSGLSDFMKFYGLKLCSVVLFDYFGRGDFVVKCYNHRATEIKYSTNDPVDFFKSDKMKTLKKDEFIYNHQSLEIEKYMGSVIYNALRNDPDDFKIQVDDSQNNQETQHLVLPESLRNLYNSWKGMKKIILKFGFKKWEVDVSLVEDTCVLGEGWCEFIKESEICSGDVIGFHIMDEPHIANVCIFKKDDIISEKEEGSMNGCTSFYKVVLDGVLEHGYVLLPTMFNEESLKRLAGTRKIIIAGHEWNIRYNENWKFLYGLEKMLKKFSLNGYDSIHFTSGVNGVWYGRIYEKNGMEINYERNESPTNTTDDFFLYEDCSEDLDGNMDDVNEGNPVAVRDGENVRGNLIVNIPNNVIQQFSEKVYGCNFDNRCHGVHIPKHIKLNNREWQKGDVATFRTTKGSWIVGIVLNNGKPRFSSGWSKFMREQEVKKNDILQFTLHEDDESTVFEIEVNPMI